MVSTAAELSAALSEFIRLLQRGINVEAVILYGSYAQGSPNEWSDIDVAVVSPDFESVPMWRRQEGIARLTVHRPAGISPIGYASSEYRNPAPHSFLREILRTGRVVYQAADAGK
jgi:hypothetical protein